jgi:Cys-rich four helix bundle protein (predicted Tat secretion target)
MDRRELIVATSTLIAASPALFAVVSTSALAAKSSPLDDLISTATKCLDIGLRCERLCTEVMMQGDKSMVDCMVSIQDMITMVKATSELAAHKSPLLVSIVSSCAKACEECKKQCDKHAKHHEICALCSKACAECIKACEKMPTQK